MRQLKYFSIKDIVARLANASSRNRFDQVTRTMHDIYEKRFDKNPSHLVSTAEFGDLYSTISNLNNESNFKDLFEDILSSEKEPLVVVESSSFQLSGFDGDDYRPSPVDVVVTLEDKIKSSSINSIIRIASKSVVNPQYHYNNFVNVAKAGKDSGVALWTVSFNTGKGTAKINVPIKVVAGETMLPEIFYAFGSTTPVPFTESELSKYAKNYISQTKESSTENSGFSNIGINSYLTDNCDIKEGVVSGEDESVYMNVGNADLSGDDFVSNSGSVSDRYTYTIELARQHVGKKILASSSNIQLKFGGIMTAEGKEVNPHNPSDNVVVAFNAEFDTRNGKRTITIPVTVSNQEAFGEKFYTQSEEFNLNPQVIAEYIKKENEIEADDSEIDAFSKAFLASGVTLDQLKNEIKLSVHSRDMIRAKACLSAIGSKFGQQNLKLAMADFLYLVQEGNLSQQQEEEQQNIHMGPVLL